MIFAQFLQVADVLVADLVTLAEGRPLEFSRADFRNIMRQPRTDGIFNVDFFQHGNLSFVISIRTDGLTGWQNVVLRALD